MSFVTDLVLHRMKDHLTKEMQTNITNLTDPARAGVIKIGRFQESPVNAGVYLACSFGNPTDPEHMDTNASVVARTTKDKTGIRVEGYALGGGTVWWRSAQVQFGCFYVEKKFTEEVAQTAASEVLGRLLYSLSTIYISDIIDSHGERAINAYTYGNTMFESGGPPNQYIWRGSVKVEFLTERPY